MKKPKIGLLGIMHGLYDEKQPEITAQQEKFAREVIGKLSDRADITFKKAAKTRTLRRLISAMPYHKLTQMIQYKAQQQGLQVFKIKEYYTSTTCHKCGNKGTRKRRRSK